MIKVINQLVMLLDSKDRIKLIFLTILFFFTALFEVVGLAFLIPFVNLIIDPNLVDNYALAQLFRQVLHFESENDFIFYFGISLLFYVIFAQFFRMYTAYQQINFTYVLQYALTETTIDNFLSNDFSFFVQNHSADLSKDILSEISVKVVGLIIPSLQLVSSGLLILSISAFLFYLDFAAMSLLIFIFGSIFGSLVIFTRKIQTEIGLKRYSANSKMFKILNNMLSSIKEVKFYHAEKIEAKNFNSFTKMFCDAQAQSQALSILPKYVVELVLFSIIIISALLMSGMDDEPSKYISIIVPFTFGIYKILPALQQVFFSISQLRFNSSSLLTVEKMSVKQTTLDEEFHEVKVPLLFNNRIELSSVTYNYPGARYALFKDFNFGINCNSIVGIKGPSGSGKSTLINLMLGILRPNKGCIKVDGKTLANENLVHLNTIISYVPQEVFIVDDTIAKNITLYSDCDDIDFEWLDEVVEICALGDFIKNELSDGYQTILGERGCKISGGQKQRIGIARALYRRPKLLVLDEGTSALDVSTEKKILENLHRIRDRISVLIVSHRMQTFSYCDEIFDIQDLKDTSTAIE
ncbi:ABC transporter ATP-binding protein [Roseobacter sp. HKCCD5988]|uniref:ABC transporter ATP-binding protein n=1 Tax=Roseobacter sp. HKCCD5988 TaxID=3120338 RepID=UPI0030EB2DC1